MKNATGTEGYKFDPQEYLDAAKDAINDGKPQWVARGLIEQSMEANND